MKIRHGKTLILAFYLVFFSLIFLIRYAQLPLGNSSVFAQGYGSPCTHFNPAVSLSPSSQTTTTGTPVSYTVTVTNNDNNCGTEIFNLAPSCGSVTCSLSSSSLSISSGGSSTSTLTASSNTPSTPTFYTLTVTATNSGATSYTGSGSATLTVNQATSGSTSTVVGGSGSISVSSTLSSSSDSFSCSGLPAGASCTFSPSSCATPCSTTDVISTSSSTPPGTYTIGVVENNGTQTSTSSYSLTVVGPTCNNDNVCQFGETQSSCPSDCKTSLSVSAVSPLASGFFTPGQSLLLTVKMNDSRIYATEPVKLSFYFNNIFWSSASCPISGTVITNLNVSSLPNSNMAYYVNVGNLANAITVTGICHIPLDLPANYYTLNLLPQIFSDTSLTPAKIGIYVYNNALEFLLSLVHNLFIPQT